MKDEKIEKPLSIAKLGHKSIPLREGGIEVVVERIGTPLVQLKDDDLFSLFSLTRIKE